MNTIHPTAIIDPKAKLGNGVSIGPYAIIGSDVVIGEDTKVAAHAVIAGNTTIGKENQIGIGAVIGLEPQDISYKGEQSYLKIGDRNNIREYAQIHRGTKEGSETVVGNDNFILGFSHIAHNCRIGNKIILANGALVAGYCIVDDYAFISGLCLVHQHTHIGAHVIMRGGSRVSLDVPPFCITDNANQLRGINSVGLSRRGFADTDIRAIKKCYRDLFGSAKPLNAAVEELIVSYASGSARTFLDFIRSSERGICRPEC